MSTYEWEEFAAFDAKLDPYSRWLLETNVNSIELSRLSTDRTDGLNWFFSFRDREEDETEVAENSCGLSTRGEELIWRPEGASYEFALRKGSISAILEDFLPLALEGIGAQETAVADPESDTGDTDPPPVETYLQFAPLDDKMVAKEFEKTCPLPDLGEVEINPEKAVIIGVIDDGINVAHERFVDQYNRARVDYAWHQDGVARSPSRVLFGREVTRPEIDAMRAKYDTEEEVLRALRLVDHVKAEASTLSKSFSHGTFVLDRLAGYSSRPDRYGRNENGDDTLPEENEGTDPRDRRIVSVQLHRRVTEETSGALYTLFAIAGLQYIVDRAWKVAERIVQRENGKIKRRIPLVVNFSYGLAGGPHNGDHLFERFVDQLANTLDDAGDDAPLGPLIVNMPTGNRHLVKGHAHVRANRNDTQDLEVNWITQPQDKSPNYLEVWIPYPQNPETRPGGQSTTCTVTIEPPFSNVAPHLPFEFDLTKLGAPYGFQLVDEDGGVFARISLDSLDADHQTFSKRESGYYPSQYPKVRLLIALLPTRPVSDGTAHLPPGSWRIRVVTGLKKDQFIEAWVQRDDSPPLFRRPGRQSYLEHLDWTPRRQRIDDLEENVRRLGLEAGLSRYGALNGLATAVNMLRVSGVRHYDADKPALYSGAAHNGMAFIEIAAPADRSRVVAGLLGTGGRSGSVQVMLGTSVSAPIVGRRLANFLAGIHGCQTSEDVRRAFLDSLQVKKARGAAPSVKNLSPIEETLSTDPDLGRLRGGRPLSYDDDKRGRKYPYLRR